MKLTEEHARIIKEEHWRIWVLRAASILSLAGFSNKEIESILLDSRIEFGNVERLMQLVKIYLIEQASASQSPKSETQRE